MNLLWVDLETTGFGSDLGSILEIAWRFTDPTSENLIAKNHFILKYPEGYMECEAALMHAKSGLLTACSQSSTTIQQVEDDLIATIGAYHDKSIHLAGRSVWFDRKFIRKYFPRVMEKLHHRIIDVSSFEILFELRGIKFGEEKPTSHRAETDIDYAMRQYKFFLSSFPKQEST